MKKYRLNDLDDNWIFEANNESEASLRLINDVLSKKFTNLDEAIEKYEEYCVDVNVDPSLDWELVDEE